MELVTKMRLVEKQIHEDKKCPEPGLFQLIAHFDADKACSLQRSVGVINFDKMDSRTDVERNCATALERMPLAKSKTPCNALSMK